MDEDATDAVLLAMLDAIESGEDPSAVLDALDGDDDDEDPEPEPVKESAPPPPPVPEPEPDPEPPPTPVPPDREDEEGTPDWAKGGDEADADEDGEPIWPGDDDEAPLDEDDDQAEPVRESLGAPKKTGEFKDRRGRRMCYQDGKRVRCPPRPGEANKPPPAARFQDNKDHPKYAGTGEAWDKATWVPAGKTPAGRLRWMHGDTGAVKTGDRPKEPPAEEKRAAHARRQAQLARPPEAKTGFWLSDEAKATVDASARDLFGDAKTAGVVPLLGLGNGTTAVVQPNPYARGSVKASLSHPDVDHWERTVHPRPDGTLAVSNDLFFLKPGQRGGGFGTKAFADQVRGMVREGGSTIGTTAGKGGAAGNKMNGYYTWAKLGYDAPLEDGFRRRLPESLKAARTVQDLMETKEGAEHWKRSGYMTHMDFDTSPGSRSLQVLNRYLVSKGQPPIDDGPEVMRERAAKIAERRARVAVSAEQHARAADAALAERSRRQARPDSFPGFDEAVVRQAREFAAEPETQTRRAAMAPGEYADFVHRIAETRVLNDALRVAVDADPEARQLAARMEAAAGVPPGSLGWHARYHSRNGPDVRTAVYRSYAAALRARGVPEDQIPTMSPAG